MMDNCHKREIREDQCGFTLVELLISIVVAVIVGLAIFSILYSTYNSRAISEKLTGRADRAILMKDALEHTVTNAGYVAYTTSAGTTTPCSSTISAISPAVPTSSAMASQISSMTVGWTVGTGGTCTTCTGTFAISGNVATWTVSGGSVCGQSNSNSTSGIATFPVGTGWTLSIEPATSCLGPAFNTTAPAVIATNISSQDSGTSPVEISACLFNLQGQ
ncbi:PulJ/GspJ family protein [Acidithiobacillus ferrooxidans]|uniref:PulJ/GspJ family protein n=1 Tax=Acidithiobacillus ferrooxidans TaxID=920 RepID=UPI0013D63111|nr:prepilin-type N-terminal cleavage/methylation domain-containing protein [Acidithiobacillus ferrooxidans]